MLKSLLILFTFAIMDAFNSKGEDHPFSMNVDELIKAIKARNPSTCRSNSSKNNTISNQIKRVFEHLMEKRRRLCLFCA